MSESTTTRQAVTILDAMLNRLAAMRRRREASDCGLPTEKAGDWREAAREFYRKGEK